MRRVVVTGLGLVTPLADGVEKTWERILAGQSGAGRITGFDPSRLTTQYACEVPLGDGADGTFHADSYLDPKEKEKIVQLLDEDKRKREAIMREKMKKVKDENIQSDDQGGGGIMIF